MIPERIVIKNVDDNSILGGLLFPRTGEFKIIPPSVRIKLDPVKKRVDVLENITDI